MTRCYEGDPPEDAQAALVVGSGAQSLSLGFRLRALEPGTGATGATGAAGAFNLLENETSVSIECSRIWRLR